MQAVVGLVRCLAVSRGGTCLEVLCLWCSRLVENFNLKAGQEWVGKGRDLNITELGCMTLTSTTAHIHRLLGLKKA